MYSRRKEIGVMKFVGATDWFIRWPFIFEGVIIGIIGALVAFGLVSWGYISILGQTKTTDLFVETVQGTRNTSTARRTGHTANSPQHTAVLSYSQASLWPWL